MVRAAHPTGDRSITGTVRLMVRMAHPTGDRSITGTVRLMVRMAHPTGDRRTDLHTVYRRVRRAHRMHDI